jgi:ribosomal protein L7/L12
MLRDATGLQLKEAKETIENLMNYRIDALAERCYYDVSPKPHNKLNEQCTKIFDTVCEGFRRY